MTVFGLCGLFGWDSIVGLEVVGDLILGGFRGSWRSGLGFL